MLDTHGMTGASKTPAPANLTWNSSILIKKGHHIEINDTVIGSQSESLHSEWISHYLRHFSAEMAEIWSPGTFFEDVWTHKISALYHFYFQNYQT